MSNIVPAGEHGNTIVGVGELTAAVEVAQREAERLANANTDIETADMTPEQRRDAINVLRSDMDAARAELKRSTAALQNAFTAQLEAAQRALEPLATKAAQLMSAVEAISLYLGSDEQIVLLREGEQAPADTPITVYQDTLFMDEEMALAAEQAGIADATIEPGEKGWGRFDDWLLASETHVRQVCPAVRGVVALRSARTQRRSTPGNLSGDGSEVTHFLVVNGDQLAWVLASADFNVGNRLIPAANEFEKFFYDRYTRDEHGNPAKLTFGTDSWDRAQQAADSTQKHFLKIALILQGIVDRSPLLSPLPGENISFTNPQSYDDGHIQVVVTDDHNTLPSGVLPFGEFRRRIMDELEVGQRVVLGNIPYDELYGGRDHGSGILTPRGADRPPTGVPLSVKRRKNGDLYVSFKRTDTVWKRDVPVPDKPGWVSDGYYPASGYATVKLGPSDQWALAVDHPLVTQEALEWYLVSRENRRHFQTMIPLLRSALRVLRAETVAEAPFAALLETQLCARHNINNTDAHTVVEDVCRWWKTKRREHRALIAGDAGDNQAFNEIVAELERRMTLRALEDDPAVIGAIETSCADAMYIGRRTDGTYIALEPADERDIYVHVHTFTAKRGTPKPVTSWVTAPDTRGYKTIRATTRYTRWPRYVDVSGEPTGPELGALLDAVHTAHPDALRISWERYWSWGGSARDLTVQIPGTPPQVNTEQPLTQTSTQGEINNIPYTWKRESGEVVLVESRYRDTTVTRIRSQGVDSFDEIGNADILWTQNSERDKVINEYADVWKSYNQLRGPYETASQNAAARLETAWEQREVEDEYARFVAKYGREATGRWETHLATVKRRLTFPHSRVFSPLFDRAAEAHLIGDHPLNIGVLIAGTGYDTTNIPADVLGDTANLEF